jgi:hypothetical protein
MITAAINIGIYTLIFFLVGIFKPQWALFFMKNPSRMIVMIITLVMVMVGMTLFGEGTRQKKLAAQMATPVDQSVNSAVPVPTEK